MKTITTTDGILTDAVVLYVSHDMIVARDVELNGYARCIPNPDRTGWLWLETRKTLEQASSADWRDEPWPPQH